MTSQINVSVATIPELLAFYNAHSGREAIKRFSDRKVAERRVTGLLAERQFNLPQPLQKEGVCPNCGSTDLFNGHAPRGMVIDEEYVVGCHACGWSYDYRKGSANKTRTPAGPRPAMRQSLKLDRRITHLGSGAIYNNACQVWKAGLVSASQGDRLSALLYGAAKRGEFPAVTVNGHDFKLTAGGAA
jgi:RNase P subunit RPR2